MQLFRNFFILIIVFITFGCSNNITEKQKQEIFAFKDMSALTTVEYTISKVIKADDKATWYKIGDRKIVMSVMAYAKAGIDLSKVSKENINQKNGTIQIQIPQANLVSLSIPPEEIQQEFTAISGLRTNFNNEEKNNLLIQAEKNIRSSLDSIGILKKAESNAIFFIENFVRKLGYQKINVTITKPA